MPGCYHMVRKFEHWEEVAYWLTQKLSNPVHTVAWGQVWTFCPDMFSETHPDHSFLLVYFLNESQLWSISLTQSFMLFLIVSRTAQI